MDLATIEWEGPGSPTLLLAHATGFHKLVWSALVDELRADGFAHRVIAHDFRSHGQSPKLADHHWSHFGDDVLEVVAEIDGPVIGVGHSMGGAAMLLASLAHPERFLGQILIEPIIVPSQVMAADEDHPLVLGAARRRRAFASPEAALAHFAQKAVFSRWTEQSLSSYVEGGLVAHSNEWVLACEPQDESATFRASATAGIYERLGEVTVPTVLVIGAETDTYPLAFVRELQERLGGCRLEQIGNTGHFAPMEQPAHVAKVILSATAGFLSS